MFSSGPNYTKLKTHLRLAVNRLKLLEKKKTELAQKSRKEIADYLATGKVERARIRVEHIIREDYLVEAMEVVEMYCDLLLARFGLLTQMKDLDEGIAEPVSSILWVAPRLQTDVLELKVISDILTSKYGHPYAEAARTATGDHKVSEKLMHKLAIQAPPKLLVEKYLIEIANNYHIEYEPDPQVMKDDIRPIGLDTLIDFSDNNLNGGGSGRPQPAGFIGYPQPPQLPVMPDPPMNRPFNYPPPGGNNSGNSGSGGGGGGASAPPFSYNIPPNVPTQMMGPDGYPEKKDLNTQSNFIHEESMYPHSLPPGYPSISPDDNLEERQHSKIRPPSYSMAINNDNLQNLNKPKPQPRAKIINDQNNNNNENLDDLINLPNVPSDFPDLPNSNNNCGGGGGGGGATGFARSKDMKDDEIDFDDLSKRFEELKKRK